MSRYQPILLEKISLTLCEAFYCRRHNALLLGQVQMLWTEKIKEIDDQIDWFDLIGHMVYRKKNIVFLLFLTLKSWNEHLQ